MDAIRILCMIDDIYDAVDWLLEWIPLEDLTPEIRRIRDLVDVLRDTVEDVFEEKGETI